MSNRKQPERTELDAKQTFAIKEWAVFVPTLTTALALSWQIGAMLPIGGFVFFGLSDHLIASARALPLALAISSFVTLLYGMIGRMSPAQAVKLAAIFYRAFLYFIGPAVLVAAFVMIGAGVDPFAITAVMLVIIISGSTALLRNPPSFNVGLFLIAAALVNLTVAIAYDLTVLRLWRIDHSHRLDLMSITTKSGTSRGVVLMSGERGYLVYSPPGSMSFVRSDEVVQFDYRR